MIFDKDDQNKQLEKQRWCIRMKENVVPLLRRTTNETIYFDFNNQKLFIQKFTGEHEEYSKSLVVLLGLFGSMIVIPFLTKKLDFMSSIPPIINYILFSAIGYLAAKAIGLTIMNKIKGEKIYKDFDRKQVKKIIANQGDLQIIWWTQLVLITGYIIGFFICLFSGMLSIDLAIIVSLGCFLIILLQDSVRPFTYKKAIKILKKKMA